MDVEESMWALDEDWDGSTDATRSLMISLARPALTAEELTWKKGKKQAVASSVFKAAGAHVLCKQHFVARNCKLHSSLCSDVTLAHGQITSLCGKRPRTIEKINTSGKQVKWSLVKICQAMMLCFNRKHLMCCCCICEHRMHTLLPGGCCLK